MRRVLIESPLAGNVERNVLYARLCLRDSLLRGEAPFASHLLYAQPHVLDDLVPHEREMGILAGLALGRDFEASAVYRDFGISPGMRSGIARAIQAKRIVEYRELPADVFARHFPDHVSEGASLMRDPPLLGDF